MMRGSSEQLGNKGSRIERDHKSEIETDELGEILLIELMDSWYRSAFLSAVGKSILKSIIGLHTHNSQSKSVSMRTNPATS